MFNENNLVFLELLEEVGIQMWKINQMFFVGSSFQPTTKHESSSSGKFHHTTEKQQQS